MLDQKSYRPLHLPTFIFTKNLSTPITLGNFRDKTDIVLKPESY
jgi:hypothetical protein